MSEIEHEWQVCTNCVFSFPETRPNAFGNAFFSFLAVHLAVLGNA